MRWPRWNCCGSTIPAAPACWSVAAPVIRPAVDLVRAPDALRPVVARVLDRVAVVEDLSAARELVRQHADVRAVTAEGDLLGADWAVGGSGRSQSTIEVQAAVDEANDKLIAAEHSLRHSSAALAGAKAEQQARRDEVGEAKDALNDAKVRQARSTERLTRLRQVVRSAQAEVERAGLQCGKKQGSAIR